MRLIALRLLAASSLLLGSAAAATRPHYSGNLRVMVRSAPGSLDPANLAGTVDGRNIARLLFDTLTTLDDRGIVQPGLASSWQSDPENRNWQFALRPGVTFCDGSPLTPESAAASLRTGNPAWHVLAGNNSVAIRLDSSNVDLTAVLALVSNSIVRREGGTLAGTGPFTVSEWLPGKKLALTAREDYWSGRAFLSSVEIDLGGDVRALDLGKYHVKEIATEQARRVAGSRVSAPSELLALVFTRTPASAAERRQRGGLSSSIDRKVVAEVLLQGGAEPARGLLPGWLTGYDFLFSADTNLPSARQAVGESGQMPAWSLGYDANDPLARLVAERIALNAADAGIKLLPIPRADADVRLVRLNLASLDPHIAIESWAANIGLTPPKFAGASSEELYAAERSLLQTQQVIPLVHVKAAVAVAGSVNGWTNSRNGEWNLAEVWLGVDKP
jgi:MarR-like DNA-binding transcriptional regulator SgrR of sgrS sRNA